MRVLYPRTIAVLNGATIVGCRNGRRTIPSASSGCPAVPARRRARSFLSVTCGLGEARQRRDAEGVSIDRERRLQLLQRAVQLGRDQREDAFALRFDRL